jgi:hypothetical protein
MTKWSRSRTSFRPTIRGRKTTSFAQSASSAGTPCVERSLYERANGYTDWRVIITILGWIFVIAGFIRIVLPRQMASVATTIYSGSIAMTIVGVVILVLGGYLSFEGYRPVSN